MDKTKQNIGQKNLISQVLVDSWSFFPQIECNNEFYNYE